MLVRLPGNRRGWLAKFGRIEGGAQATRLLFAAARRKHPDTRGEPFMSSHPSRCARNLTPGVPRGDARHQRRVACASPFLTSFWATNPMNTER